MITLFVLVVLQILDENNILQDGTLIDLCGATLLWRSAAGLSYSPVRYIQSVESLLYCQVNAT